MFEWRESLRGSVRSDVHLLSGLRATLVGFVVGDRVQQRVVVESGQIRVLRLDVHHHRIVVHAQPHLARPVVVQVRERNLCEGTGGMSGLTGYWSDNLGIALSTCTWSKKMQEEPCNRMLGSAKHDRCGILSPQGDIEARSECK